MKRWNGYGQRDSQLLVEGDKGYGGINMTLDRALLPEGTLARSENSRLRTGPNSPRPGTIQPADFDVVFENTIVGSGVYSDPNGAEILLIGTLNANYVWALQYGKDPFKINITAGEDLTGVISIKFVQAFDKVLLLRQPVTVGPQLVWDGTVGNEFEVVVLSVGGDTLMVRSWDGEPFQNRVLFYSSRFNAPPSNDAIYMSDVFDYSSYDPALNVFRINSGQSGWITRVWPYGKGSIAVLKNQSVHILTNFAVDPTLAEQKMVSSRIGAHARRCIAEGNDQSLIFLSLSGGGFYRMKRVDPAQDFPVDAALDKLPVSERIKPMMRLINWNATALQGCAESLDDYAFFGVTLFNGRTSAGSNAIFVYNLVTEQWESAPDQWGDLNFSINALHVTNYAGSRRLYAIDYINKIVYLLYEGTVDVLGPTQTEYDIAHLLETRGYAAGQPTCFKRYPRCAISISTANPKITVTALTDGMNEAKLLTTRPITRDQSKFYPHGHADFDFLNGDPLEPRRQDYTVPSADTFVGQDFELFDVGDISIIPGVGHAGALGPKQDALIPLAVRANGRWLSLRIENNQGQCDVLATAVESRPIKAAGLAA